MESDDNPDALLWYTQCMESVLQRHMGLAASPELCQLALSLLWMNDIEQLQTSIHQALSDREAQEAWGVRAPVPIPITTAALVIEELFQMHAYASPYLSAAAAAPAVNDMSDVFNGHVPISDVSNNFADLTASLPADGAAVQDVSLISQRTLADQDCGSASLPPVPGLIPLEEAAGLGLFNSHNSILNINDDKNNRFFSKPHLNSLTHYLQPNTTHAGTFEHEDLSAFSNLSMDNSSLQLLSSMWQSEEGGGYKGVGGGSSLYSSTEKEVLALPAADEYWADYDFDFVDWPMLIERVEAVVSANYLEFLQQLSTPQLPTNSFSVQAIFNALQACHRNVDAAVQLLIHTCVELTCRKPCRHMLKEILGYPVEGAKLLAGASTRHLCLRSDCMYEHDLSQMPCKYWLFSVCSVYERALEEQKGGSTSGTSGTCIEDASPASTLPASFSGTVSGDGAGVSGDIVQVAVTEGREEDQSLAAKRSDVAKAEKAAEKAPEEIVGLKLLKVKKDREEEDVFDAAGSSSTVAGGSGGSGSKKMGKKKAQQQRRAEKKQQSDDLRHQLFGGGSSSSSSSSNNASDAAISQMQGHHTAIYALACTYLDQGAKLCPYRHEVPTSSEFAQELIASVDTAAASNLWLTNPEAHRHTHTHAHTHAYAETLSETHGEGQGHVLTRQEYGTMVESDSYSSRFGAHALPVHHSFSAALDKGAGAGAGIGAGVGAGTTRAGSGSRSGSGLEDSEGQQRYVQIGGGSNFNTFNPATTAVTDPRGSHQRAAAPGLGLGFGRGDGADDNVFALLLTSRNPGNDAVLAHAITLFESGSAYENAEKAMLASEINTATALCNVSSARVPFSSLEQQQQTQEDMQSLLLQAQQKEVVVYTGTPIGDSKTGTKDSPGEHLRINDQLTKHQQQQQLSRATVHPGEWVDSGESLTQAYQHSREQAQHHARARNRLFEQARSKFLQGLKAEARSIGEEGRAQNQLMKDWHQQAALQIFVQRNSRSAVLTGKRVDLHGLHVEEAVRCLYALFPLIQQMQTHTQTHTEIPATAGGGAGGGTAAALFTVITGTGHHTLGPQKGISRLFPSVKQTCEEVFGYKVRPVYDAKGFPGALQVTIPAPR